MTVDGALHPIDQVTKQLHKLVNVIKIRDMEPEQTIAREMAVFKVSASVESRGEIMQFAEIFRGEVIDVSRRTLTIEVTGDTGQDRRLRAHGPAPRPGRDGAHGRGRDQPLAPGGVARRAVSGSDRGQAAVRSPAHPRTASSEASERDRRTLASATIEVEALDSERHSLRLPPRRRIAGSAGSSPTARDSRSAGIGTAWEDRLPRRRTRSPTSRRAAPSCPASVVAAEPDGLPAGAGPVWVAGLRVRARRRAAHRSGPRFRRRSR